LFAKNFTLPIIFKTKNRNSRLVFIKDLEIGVLGEESTPNLSIEKACEKLLEKLVDL
jgi:hypothetical protein